ncbi:Nuclear transcription factor Y subunit beta [Orchesella cincta]|uniref:Nuclear transcription factor Y subunit beta n=1 Tax=Orchesella cincta TaxID=48709 RepID=A0A1D2NK17_ORCCI|nr:Nuclear transcription factor Y subunit beta [Orchesella cincta]
MMDSASENEDLGTSYLTHQVHDASHIFLSAAEEDTEDSRDGDDDKPTGLLREQDRFLPIANVARLMKKSIPKTGKIAKEARECVQECVSEFVSFITSEASDRCHQEKRKTINGEDILFAMSSLGFDNYVEPLKMYLQKYREANKGDKAIAMGSAGEGSESTTTAASFVGETVEEATANPQGNTVVFAYDLGHGHVQVQPTTTSAGNGTNYTVG